MEEAQKAELDVSASEDGEDLVGPWDPLGYNLGGIVEQEGRRSEDVIVVWDSSVGDGAEVQDLKKILKGLEEILKGLEEILKGLDMSEEAIYHSGPVYVIYRD